MDDKIIDTPVGSAYIPPKEVLAMESIAIREHIPEDVRISARLFSEQFPNGLDSGLLDMFTTIVKSCDLSAVSDVNPEELQAYNIAMATSPGFSITQLNLALNQLGQLPDASFQVVKQIVVQNRSKILDTAKANHDIISDLIEQIPKDGPDEAFAFPTIITELLTSVKDSIRLPKPNPKHLICISKSMIKKYQGPISIFLSIVGIVLTICFNHSNTELSKQQQVERMQEEAKQTRLLEQISENTAPNDTEDQHTEEVPKNTMR